MSFAVAVSAHPVPALATGEVVGQVLEGLGTAPDLAVLVVSAGHAGALEDAGRAVRSLLQPGVLVGWAAREVAARYPRPAPPPGRSLPAVGLWAGAGPGVRRVRDPATAGPLGFVVAGGGGALPVGRDGLAGGRSDVPGAPLLLDGEVYTDGVVGAAWTDPSTGRPLAFDGHRPIGPVVTATAVDGPLLVGLEDHPAMEVLAAIARDRVPASDIALINAGVHLVAVDGGQEVALRGRDRATGALAVDPPLAVGDAVRFCVVDPATATRQARADLAAAAGLAWDLGAAGAVVGPDAEAAGGAVLSCSAVDLVGPGARPARVGAVAFGEQPVSGRRLG